MYLFEPAARPALQIHNDERLFPVRQVYCIGRNYADHAAEMGFEATPEAPFYFLKPAESLTHAREIMFPPQTEKLQHEVELVVALKSGGQGLTAEQAEVAIAGYALGLDLTRRDLQIINREQGRPWEVGKVFDNAAPIGPLHLIENTGLLTQGSIELDVNGERRQSGDLNQMIHSAVALIQFLSTLQTLHPGDLIFTGTPAGVSDLKPGDQLHARCQGLSDHQVSLAVATHAP